MAEVVIVSSSEKRTWSQIPTGLAGICEDCTNKKSQSQ